MWLQSKKPLSTTTPSNGVALFHSSPGKPYIWADAWLCLSLHRVLGKAMTSTN